jgi:AhpD family alkylhydroperoxidase
MPDPIQNFQAYRERMNAEILSCGHLGIKRFFALDHDAYENGALPSKTKELLGLVASTVLRCDDCITYHLIQCQKEGVSDKEFQETMNVALIVGGSITIPHIRRAFETWGELKKKARESLA